MSFSEVEPLELGCPLRKHLANGTPGQDYLRTFVLHRHLELLPEHALRDSFARQVAAASARDDPPWTPDYWRLNLRARKAA